MSLYENGSSNMVMPVGPMYGNGGGNGGFGWGDGSFWIIVLFLFAIMGNNGFGSGWGGNGGMMPMMMNNTTNDVQRGFDQQAVMGGLNGVTAGINSLAQGQCAGFAGVNAGVNAGFANAETAANARQMASMQQNWAAQSAIDSRLDSMAMTQQQCCCENRAAVADLKYAMATEAAATRANCDANSKAMMDKLCQLELDGVKQNYENRIAGMQQNFENHIAGMQNQIDALRTQVSDAKFDASQNAQTATIAAGQRNLANEVEQYVLPTPRPAYVVQNPNCCGNNYGWGGCGCGAA